MPAVYYLPYSFQDNLECHDSIIARAVYYLSAESIPHLIWGVQQTKVGLHVQYVWLYFTLFLYLSFLLCSALCQLFLNFESNFFGLFNSPYAGPLFWPDYGLILVRHQLILYELDTGAIYHYNKCNSIMFIILFRNFKQIIRLSFSLAIICNLSFNVKVNNNNGWLESLTTAYESIGSCCRQKLHHYGIVMLLSGYNSDERRGLTL